MQGAQCNPLKCSTVCHQHLPHVALIWVASFLVLPALCQSFEVLARELSEVITLHLLQRDGE